MFHHATSNEPNYSDQVQADVESGRLPAMRWANFSRIEPDAARFYDERDYDLAWVKQGKPTAAATAMMNAFSHAAERGLNPEDYDASRWEGRTGQLGNADGAALFDVALTVNAMRFISDLHQGRLDPAHFNFGVKGYDSKKLDLANELSSKFVDASDVDAALSAEEPQSAQYRALEQALPKYRALSSEDRTTPLPSVSKPVEITAGYPALDDLAEKLTLNGDLPSAEPQSQQEGTATSEPSQGQKPKSKTAQAMGKVASAITRHLPHGHRHTAAAPQQDASATTTQIAAPQPSTTDPAALTEALKKFQSEHGLQPDGKLSADTVDALNQPMSARLLAIIDSMERWRWLSDEYQNAGIVVNLPEFVLRAYEGTGNDRHEVFQMEVVDGQSKEAEHHTPIIADHMKYLIFRPYWNLPVDIAKKDLLPHIEKDPKYLDEKNYETVDSKGNPEPASDDAIANGKVLVRQKPGVTNALGLVKFMFPNQFDVYLHDTNEKALFSKTRRDFSHGCVRLQDPPKLATWLLRDSPKWDADAVNTAMQTGDDNHTVPLPKPLPIVVFYATAWSENGTIHFFKDMYGYDADMNQTLSKGRPYPVKPEKPAGQMGV